jgi:Flp pilus assembly protein TadG
MMKTILFKIKDEKGQATVEFALVAMLLLILVFGIMEFGRAWFRADLLKNAANIAARTCVVSKITASAQDAGKAAIPKYDPAITYIDVPNDCATASPMTAMTVTVTEKFQTAVPNIIPILKSITLTRTATYSMEQ